MIWRLAQTVVPEPGSIFDFIQYGVLGLVVLGFIVGWIWSKPSVTHLMQERDRTIADRDKTITRLIDERNEQEKEIDELLAKLDKDHNDFRRMLEQVRRALEKSR